MEEIYTFIAICRWILPKTQNLSFSDIFNMQDLTLDLYSAQWFTNTADFNFQDLVLNKCF